MRNKHEIIDERDDLIKQVMAMSKSNEPSPIEVELKKKYPGVPYPLSEVWERSDYDIPRNLEREELVNKTAEALAIAANLCPSIQDTNAPTTFAELQNYTRTLKGAVFRTEALLDEMQFKYPLPTKERYRHTRSDKSLQTYLPQILLNTEDRVIIWMPKMPTSSRTANNLLFAELLDLLYNEDFSHLQNWHCDFIHVFPNGALGCRDVDNYPYKPVIDALAMAFRSRDSSESFSIGMYNLRTENTKPGCYVCVSKRENKACFFAEFEDLIARLERP